MEMKKTGLELLREPFPAHQISKLPKPTKAQTDEVKNDFKSGIRCGVCGGWHHPKVVHLDYVGHAALTDRLLDADPSWFWEPLAIENGLPVLDHNGGMWIRLTVCNTTRLGYGHAGEKSGGDAIKEVIGDALRNAAMRFGAALDLWHKGDLHIADETTETPETPVRPPKPESAKTVSQVAWEAEDEESKAYLKTIADDVKGLLALPDVKQASEKIEDSKLSADEKVAIWYLFDSKERSALKAYSDNQKAAK